MGTIEMSRVGFELTTLLYLKPNVLFPLPPDLSRQNAYLSHVKLIRVIPLPAAVLTASTSSGRGIKWGIYIVNALEGKFSPRSPKEEKRR